METSSNVLLAGIEGYLLLALFLLAPLLRRVLETAQQQPPRDARRPARRPGGGAAPTPEARGPRPITWEDLLRGDVPPPRAPPPPPVEPAPVEPAPGARAALGPAPAQAAPGSPHQPQLVPPADLAPLPAESALEEDLGAAAEVPPALGAAPERGVGDAVRVPALPALAAVEEERRDPLAPASRRPRGRLQSAIVWSEVLGVPLGLRSSESDPRQPRWSH